MHKKALENITSLIIEAEDLLNKAEIGLVETDKEKSFSEKFKRIFSTFLKELDDYSQLEYKRDYCQCLIEWTKKRAGSFLGISEAKEKIKPKYEFIKRVLNRNNNHLPTKSKYIEANRPFQGRQYFKTIIKQAKTNLCLMDDYFDANILDVLGEILDEGQSIAISILSRSAFNRKFKTVKNVIPVFNKQYKGAIKEFVDSDKLHGRCIILDYKRVFNPDASFHDWGLKLTTINEFDNKQEIDEMINYLKDCIKTGIPQPL